MISKSKKKKVKINFVVFVWILLCNLIVQLFAGQLASISFHSWAFFLINVLFFLIEKDFKEKFWPVFIGSIVGIVAAGMLSLVAEKLLTIGLNPVISVMIPLSLCLFVIIVLHPVFPGVFNNCSFAYFLVSLIDSASAFENMGAYILSATAGHFIVNVSTIFVIRLAINFLDKGNEQQL